MILFESSENFSGYDHYMEISCSILDLSQKLYKLPIRQIRIADNVDYALCPVFHQS